MFIIDIIPTTKIPHPLAQILSYFSISALPLGAIVQIPLGKRKETGVVVASKKIDAYKMVIKKAKFELKNVSQVLSAEPLLTKKQIELALWLGQYYLASPGIFIKMMMPKKVQSLKLKIQNNSNFIENPRQGRDNSKLKINKEQKIILTPSIAWAKKLAQDNKNSLVWHSNMSQKKLLENWRQVRNGEIKIVIGTRSAVFLPFTGLKEIIIEDETNSGHKSWDMFPHYRAHEAAHKLAELFKAKLKLKSEIPSVESLFINSSDGNTDFISMPQEVQTKVQATANAAIVDMRTEIKEGNSSIFSRVLQDAIKKILLADKHNQAIFYINRRGAANFVLCRDCGYTELCPNCEAPLAHHLSENRPLLLCHRCGTKKLAPGLCPACRSWRIKTFGAGTQRAELELKKLFPELKILRLDSDAAPDIKTQQTIIEEFREKKAQVLIGTQMLLNQSLPKVDLVALLAADTLLRLPDWRAGERTWQTVAALKNLLVEKSPQPLLIQTYNPENQTLSSAAQGNWQTFYQQEIEARQELDYPPFSQLVKLTFRHKIAKRAGQEAQFLAAKLRNANKDADVQISDALPAFVPKEKGKFAWNIIIKFKITDPKLQISNEFLLRRNSLLQYVPSNWEIDVDPEDLL